MSGRTRQHGHSAIEGVAHCVTRPAVMPHKRGMQPPPQDANALAKTLYRLRWELKLLHNKRAPLVVLLDRYDSALVRLRRQYDEYAAALEALDPQMFAQLEDDRREFDDPKRALEWAQRGAFDREVES